MTITETKLKKILIDQRKEYQRYLKVVAESFDSKLGLVVESLSDMQRQLKNLRDMVAKNTEDIEIIKADIQVIKNELKRKVDRDEFAVLEKRVLFLEKKIARA